VGGGGVWVLGGGGGGGVGDIPGTRLGGTNMASRGGKKEP